MEEGTPTVPLNLSNSPSNNILGKRFKFSKVSNSKVCIYAKEKEIIVKLRLRLNAESSNFLFTFQPQTNTYIVI